MLDWELKRAFRVSRESFQALMELLAPLLARGETMAALSCGSPASLDVKVALGLRFLAGSSHLDLALQTEFTEPQFIALCMILLMQ